MRITTEFFENKKTEEIAESLLGQYLVHETSRGILAGYLVDVEAYLGPEDEAAHSFGLRQTPRLAAMYQPAGTIYLYTMHTHLILNFVTQAAGQPQGVMIRGLQPVENIPLMIENRQGISSVEISNGPGKLVTAMGITKELYGKTLFGSELYLLSEKAKQPQEILRLPRIGIPNKGIWTDKRLRYAVAGNPYISKQKKQAIDQENFGWLPEDKKENE
ncbi:DNA-3-methyladenine glycosylase [Enterococcus sp. PF1-24]|uniref:DNA-3-methyladenine glycosylase n=1 Tax=unclassified Enterococcus TaxID=2608891 RepID=UPI0024770A21|nr:MULTISPECIES: DNA-3-methyladenine glycosylase [unclassified Enterococcus]MDH6365082.1 DNA-3-methyladenine glycosylase [Enterococcus sp. PFB1-1]MDH6402145.1 DNA-3-methyladenine glycosylase [Enterococcus sp. PF1-24]